MNIRPATIQDAFHLFEWRNDPLTRSMSKNSEPIDWNCHISWLTARLSRPLPRIYIAEVDRIPVGTFRVDEDQISYTVAPSERTKGIGSAMLRKAREMFGPLRADIYERNVPSIKIAERAGMTVHLLVTP